MNPIVSTLIKGMLYFILKAKQGGKYLDRKRVVDKKTGKMVWGNYKYKPMQQRAAHEVTRGKFEKVTKLSGDEHKNQIEHALQNGIHVSLHVLRDYPDLAVKYHQQARLAKADKIRAKVKTHKEKERMEREVRLNTPEGLKNNPIKLEAERMMREDGLIKDVPVSDNREVENNFDTMPESKPEPAKNPDLKANFESWKEERKQAAPAFKLEQEDITSKEKNTRFNDAQGGLFGKKPVTHESYAKKDFKPSLALEGNETITSLVTAVKSALMREGLDTKAREFVDKAFKEKDINSLKKLASEYVDVKESSQVSTPSTENKGSEEKKMELGDFDYKEIIGDKFGEYPNVAEKILHFFKGSTKSVDGIIKLIRHSPEKMLMLMDSMIEKGVTSKYVNSQTLHENDKQAMIKIIESMKPQKVKLTSGSDKQLEWATGLAKKAMQYINDKYIKEKLANNLEENGDGKYDKIISLLQSKHDAKWWIDWAKDFSLLESSLKKVGLNLNFYKE